MAGRQLWEWRRAGGMLVGRCRILLIHQGRFMSTGAQQDCFLAHLSRRGQTFLPTLLEIQGQRRSLEQR